MQTGGCPAPNNKFSGDSVGRVTPVPIPNTEVKPSKADDTAAVRQWDSRTLPGYKKSLLDSSGRLFYFLIHRGLGVVTTPSFCRARSFTMWHIPIPRVV